MTWSTVFGKGTAGVFLSFIGMGTIPTLFWYYENIQQMLGYVRYTESTIIIAFFVFPMIIFIVGGTSFYYGIKIGPWAW